MMNRYLSLSQFTALACLVFVASTPLQATPARERAETKNLPTETLASVWSPPKADDTLMLLTFKQSAPVKSAFDMGTLIEGVCVHCQIALKCRVDELGKKCPVCSCELSNGQCLTGKSEAKSWAALLKTLPLGAVLRVEYADSGKPESGLKRLAVDRHKALLSVEGLAQISSEELLKLGKSVGVMRVERSEDGKRLQLTLKDDWTTEKELRWEKALTKVGVQVVSPPTQS